MLAKNLAEWRQVVLERDNHTCQMCSSNQNIIADHIKSRYLNKKLELETNNGRALCRSCHLKYGDKVPMKPLSSKVLPIGHFFGRYSMQMVGGSTIRTSIPGWVIGFLLKSRDIKQISIQELISNFKIMWHWNNKNNFWITLEEI